MAGGVQAVEQAIEHLHLPALLHQHVGRGEHGALLPLGRDEVGVVAVLPQLHEDVVQLPHVDVCTTRSLVVAQHQQHSMCPTHTLSLIHI